MVRDFEKKDIKAIINLGKKVNDDFTELFNVEDLPVNEAIFVYEEKNKIKGFIHILINLDWIEILNLVVDEKVRRQGIGSILMDYLLSNPDLNTSKILLEVKESNVAAIKLYKKFNYFVINIRENYYGHENAIIMERSMSL